MDLDKILSLIKEGKQIPEKDLTQLLNKLLEVLYNEPTTLNLSLPITICGDVHGQLYDVFELFSVSGGIEKNYYLFLGDYVDRGFFSAETFIYIAALKIKYPERVHMLRGNHECRLVNQQYGFYDECLSRYGHPGVWKLFNEIFDYLPIAAILEGKIFCVHGGLSPHLKFVEQVPLYHRNEEIPEKGPICDLMWSDPESSLESGWLDNSRGYGYLFGKKETNEFNHINKLDLICRAHQIAMKGYEYFFGEEQIVTVWSAPNYSYTTVNKASVLKIDKSFNRNFVVYDAAPAERRVTPEELGPSGYFA